MTKSTKETIELLSCSKTSLDLWDNIYKDSLNKKPILYFQPNQTYTVRLVGPFIRAERIYIGQYNLNGILGSSNMTIDKINAILDGDFQLYQDEVRKIVDDKLAKAKNLPNPLSSLDLPHRPRARRGLGTGINAARGLGTGINATAVDGIMWKTPKGPEVQDLLYRIFSKVGWQKCVMVNALLKPQNIVQIVPFISSICDGVFRGRSQDDKINGLFAHDIEIRKEGLGLDTKFHINLSEKPFGLSKKEVERVMSDGLIDIEEILKEHLRIKEGSNYIYRMVSSYKMPNELNREFIKSVKKMDVKNHIDCVEDNINELPQEAFENQLFLDNPIESLEL